MKVATASEMREIDRMAIEKYGIPGVVLMENAGQEVVRTVEIVVGQCANKKICIFAGKGNNGGDGFAAARHLSNKGAKVKVFLLGAKSDIKGDAKVNLDIIGHMGIDVVEVIGERDWDKLKLAVTFADCLIDALVGTGFKGELSPPMKKAIECINNAEKPVVAVDIPSGIAADTGQIGTLAVQATHTVSFGLPKPGILLYPGAAFTGNFTVADIGLPGALRTAARLHQNVSTPAGVRNILMKRRPDAHKGSCGTALVVAGSQGLTGAAALASTAALRAGAGLVTLAIAESLHEIMEVKLTEVMTKPLPEIVGGALGKKALPYILELAEQCDVVAIGPGLGRQDETIALVREVIKNSTKPLVIDADGLYAIADCPDLLTQANALPVLTPHPGEMARMTGLSPAEVNEDRIYVARQAASEWGSIVVLKGARTIVAFPDGEVYINITGNAGMATGGTGDVLTGAISGLIAQGLSSHNAAVAGVYVHGIAGDIAAETGKVGMMAGDVLNALPAAIFAIQER